MVRFTTMLLDKVPSFPQHCESACWTSVGDVP